MSRVVRNKNEENRPSSSGGDSVTVKNTFLSTNVRYVHMYTFIQEFWTIESEKIPSWGYLIISLKRTTNKNMNDFEQ